MTSGRALALAVVVLCAFGADARAERQRVDGVAAIVGASSLAPGAFVILHSDVDLEVFLERARLGSPLEPAASAAERDAARERLIGRGLLVHEASRMRLDEVDDDHRSVEWRRFFERHGGARVVETLTTRLGLAPEELERYVDQDAIARSFVLASADQGGIITESEVEETYEAGDHPFVGMDLESVREPLRALLLERRVANETARWVERLSQRVVVRRNRRA